VVADTGNDGGVLGPDGLVRRDEFPAAVGVVGTGGDGGQSVPGAWIQRQPGPAPPILVGRSGLPAGGSAAPALFVGGHDVVVGDPDPGSFSGQVVLHEPGGADGSIPDVLGGVGHVRG
jgi:hypothetical protein